MAFFGDEYIFGFEFPVDDSLLVEDLDSDDDFGEEAFDDFLLKNILFSP